MFYAVSWFVVLVLLAVWSFIAWSVRALGAWAVSSAGSVAGAAAAGNVVRIPEWLASVVQPELLISLSSMVSSLSSMLPSLPDASPMITNGWSLVIMVVWAIGSLVLLAFGVLAHTLMARWRRPGSLPTRRSADPLPT